VSIDSQVKITDPKQAAIELWTADPCEGHAAGVDVADPDYYERLRAARMRYAPWMAAALGYDEAQGLRVLDVGCGQGIDLAEFGLRGAYVTGIDLTPRHVELARAHLASLQVDGKVVLGDAESLPFPDASFDRVTSNGVLHHTPHIREALREIHRVLRPGGDARILVYNRNSLHFWLQQVLYTGLMAGELWRTRSMQQILSAGVEHSSIGARPLVRVYSRRQMRRLFRAAGFRHRSMSVRHFRPEDTFVTATAPGRRLVARHSHNVGRLAGWYIIARGVR
jgi:ubiquinone/menaquinone biosynthesis C-methylase UbiE